MKKIILLIVSCTFSFAASFSQEIEWQNTIGGDKWDELYAIKATPDGGCIIGGRSFSDSAFDKTENALAGSTDYWVLKLDLNGNIQWQNTIGGFSEDELHAIALSNDGGYFLGGWSYSDISGDKTENNYGGPDYWVLKIDSLGNVQWDKDMGGIQADWLTSIAATADGGCIAGGYSWSDVSGNKTDPNHAGGGCDYWVVKLDAGGNIQWQNDMGGVSTEKLNAIMQTADGGYVCGGLSASPISNDKSENSLGDDDYWIVKLDSAGYIQWDNTIGGNQWDDLFCMDITADGGYICGGSSMSNISGDKTENCIGAGDYWVVKLDSNGTVQWDNTIGGSDIDYLYAIEQTADSGYICGGWSRSHSSGDKSENSIGYDDYWVAELNSGGILRSENTIGGSLGNDLYAMVQSTDGGYICGGRSDSKISGDKSENGNASFYHYWVVKLTDKYNLITGKLFIDANSNGFQDAGELAVSNKSVTELNTGRFSFSNQSGNYSVSVLDTGNFSVSPASINYYNTIPANRAAYFNVIHQTDSLNDFAFQPAGVFNDLCVTLTPLQPFRKNRNASYMVNYENVGTTTLNGTVIFFPDNDVTFVTSSVATSVTTDSIIWNVGTLTPFQEGSILVTVHVNAGTPIGTLINSRAEIDPILGDANTECNISVYDVYVAGSFDPNAILVDRDTVLTTELSSPPGLDYTVYFQNTGNDTAFNVRVLNNIPQTLDANSFEFVASSNPVNISYGAHSRLFTFTFDNILLPDSNVNEPASHGFIRYRIKPLSTLVAGDEIKNNAAIYFDFNQPVMTDTVVTEIVLPTGKNEFNIESSMFNVFPNPANGLVNINFLPGKNADVKIEVFNSFGQNVKTVLDGKLNPGKEQITFDASMFSDGIYFVKMIMNGEISVKKMVKM